MRIDQPSFSGSITQASIAYAELSGSFTGGFNGSFTGDITVEQAEFTNLTVKDTLRVGSENTSGTSIIVSQSMDISGSVNVGPNDSFNVDGVSVLDSAIAFAIALG